MSLTYTYHDAYLARFVDEPLEARALADVAVLAGDRTFSADWLERVAVVQAYIIAARENQADPDDLFTAKLKTYRAELSVLLPQALAAADAAAGEPGGLGLFSITLERA